MSQPWLILDSHYLCHRAFHTTGSLTHKGIATGVMFGFLKSIAGFKDQFNTDKVIFCFEHEVLHRRNVFPDYKIKRIPKDTTREQIQGRIHLRRQIEKLREDYLPRIGFKNVFRFEGYESDDIMAALSRGLWNTYGAESILITADSDLWQCLSHHTSIYSPQKQKLLTESWFVKEFGFSPRKWALVKAIAGCSTDGVPGVFGIGTKTAIKYAKGEPIKKHLLDKLLSEEGRQRVLQNRKLVKLPFDECPFPELQRDRVTLKGWREVCAELGMKSLAGRPPVSIREGFSSNAAGGKRKEK